MRGSIVGALAHIMVSAGISFQSAAIPQAVARTGNEKGSRRTAKFTNHKPGSMKQIGNFGGVMELKEFGRRLANARDYNKGLDTETRYTKKSGKAFTRVRPNPGTLNLGMNRH